MARQPRLYLPSCPQHIVQRGNNRDACFYDKTDYKVYVAYLKEVALKYDVAIHAFVLMTNHVHILATPSDDTSIGRMMQALGRRYVRYFNHTYDRTGTLWEGRYKSTLVDSENYLLTVYRYIELNPVRAEMVKHPADYPWSSYRFNAMGAAIELITPHREYQRLGNTEKERQQAYRSLFRGRMAENDLTAIRDSINKAWVLGSDRFKLQVEKKTGRRASPSTRGGDRKSRHYREGKNQ